MKKTTTKPHESREGYLMAAATRLNDDLLVKKAGTKLPDKWYVSVMEPSGKVIGRAWPASHEAHHIFVSAALGGTELGGSTNVLATLLHEMIHISVGTKEKHNKVFGAAARAVGLLGKLTSTYAGEELAVYLTALDAALGGYPHRPLEPKLKPTKGGNRVKLVSETIEGYYVYMNPKTLAEHGAPCDPEGDEMEVEA